MDGLNETAFDDGDTLGGRIVHARDLAGHDAASIAAQVGVTLDTYTEWESDRAEPRANKLLTLAGVLGVTPVWLINGTGSGPEAPGLSSAVADMTAEIDRLRTMAAQLSASADALEAQLAALTTIARA